MKLNYNMIVEAIKRAEQSPYFEAKAEAVLSISGAAPLKLKDFSSEAELIKNLLNLKCPILLLSPDELEGNGTVCGDYKNTCFNQKIVNYMKKKNVTTIFATVFYDEKNKIYQISGSELNLDEEFSEDLSEMITKAGGSWRSDVGTEDGWTSFESE